MGLGCAMLAAVRLGAKRDSRSRTRTATTPPRCAVETRCSRCGLAMPGLKARLAAWDDNRWRQWRRQHTCTHADVCCRTCLCCHGPRQCSWRLQVAPSALRQVCARLIRSGGRSFAARVSYKFGCHSCMVTSPASPPRGHHFGRPRRPLCLGALYHSSTHLHVPFSAPLTPPFPPPHCVA